MIINIKIKHVKETAKESEFMHVKIAGNGMVESVMVREFCEYIVENNLVDIKPGILNCVKKQNGALIKFWDNKINGEPYTDKYIGYFYKLFVQYENKMYWNNHNRYLMDCNVHKPKRR